MNYENVDSLVGYMLRSTNYNQDQWSHPCGAGACLAGNAVFHLGLEADEIISQGDVRRKRDGYDDAVSQFWAQHQGQSLQTPYLGDSPEVGKTLTEIMVHLSVSVEPIANRAARLLGVDDEWLDTTKVFFPQPHKHWPEPYAAAWLATMNLPNPAQTVLQRSLAVAYLLTLKAIDIDVVDRYDAEQNAEEMARVEARVEEHETFIDGYEGSDSVYTSIHAGLKKLRDEYRTLRNERRRITQEVTDRHIGNLSAEDILKMNNLSVAAS
jgi:hypothetical protein